ncbi:MAG: hemerythrin domain-containing protein, partial [Acidobacteriota bacterium]|nr:hemerythrin domain-containing protein [Acidobacteriota bacterium]
MNAIELLKDDHDKVDKLFQKVKATEEGEHQELFEKIKEELDAHAHIEEKIFYPRLKEEDELEDITLEGIEEHHQAKMFLRELASLTDDSEKFEP